MDRTRPACCWIVSSAGIAPTLDLPGTYYLEVTDRVFRQNLIAEGRFVALGRRIDLAEVRVPVFLLAGAERHRRAARSGVCDGAAVGHAAGVRWNGPASRAAISAFSWGAARLSHSWRRIARWLQAEIDNADEDPRLR